MNLIVVTFLFLTVQALGNSKAVANRSNEDSKFVRIVEDYGDVIFGVPIDYRYNDSVTDSGDGIPSVPGCPRNIDGLPWVYYGSPPRCYLAGESYPCGAAKYWLTLFPRGEAPEGICGCTCLEDVITPEFDWNKLHFCTGKDWRGNEREYANDPETKKCYPLRYERGHCKSDEWIDKVQSEDGTWTLQCVQRLTPTNSVPGAAGAPSYVLPNECEEGTKYSQLLRRCVKKFRGNFSSLG